MTTPVPPDVIDAIGEVMPPLLGTLDRVEWVQRHLYPPLAGQLADELAPRTEALGGPLRALEGLTWPADFHFMRDRLVEVSRQTLELVTAFVEAARSPQDPIGLFRALRPFARIQEALYPLAPAFTAVSRWFLEPARRADDALVESVRLGAMRDGEPRVGVLHASNERDARGGFSLYVPEQWDRQTEMPLVVALHGGHGHGRDFLWSWLREGRSRGVLVLAPTSRERTWSIMGGPDVDAEGLREMVASVGSRYPVDGTRVLLTGMSDGATYAFLCGLRADMPFTHLAPACGVLHPFLFGNGGLDRARSRPIYLVHGALDWMFPVHSARMAREALLAVGAPLVYREIDDLSHTYPRDENPRILDWLLEGERELMPARQTIREPARDIPVFGTCDVLVVGGGPAGSAAAASAAQLGADTMLVERYGHLGGMSTGGFVLWIDRMTDWQGRQVIAGFANDLLDRLPRDAVLGPPPDLWGSKDAAAVAYWKDRYNAFQGMVTWSPTVDPEMLKMASLDLVLERGVSLLLHAWVVAPVQLGPEVRGVIFESKSGRQAILAKVVIDATGDGDVFALAGASYETDVFPPDAREEFEFVVMPNIHDRMTLSSCWGGVDMERYLAFRRDHPAQYHALMARGKEQGVVDRPHVMPRNDVALFMAPKMSGYSCLDVEHLTAVEIEGRRRVRQMLDFYRREMPGFERAWLIDTSPQIGTRHSRRLVGVTKMTRKAWTTGLRHEDEIAISPPPNARYPNVSIPLGCMVPAALDGLLAAGRNLSSDTATHSFMREIPQCWAMGQAAGVAAAAAVAAGVRVRDVDVAEVQRQLIKQGVWLPAR